MNVLYLSYDGLTDPLGQSQILPYIKGLSKSHFIHIISFEKKKVFIQQRKVIEKEIDGFNIKWIPRNYHKSPTVISTIYDLWIMKSVAKEIMTTKEINIVHCRSYISMLIGLFLKKKFKIKLLFDMRGFWANERVDGKIWNLNNPLYSSIYSYFKRKEIQFALEADHIISLTETGKAELTSGRLFKNSDLKIPEEKISVVPCSTDFNLFNPTEISEPQINFWKQKLNICNTDKILIYLGSLGTWYLLEEMLIFYKTLYRKHPEYKFLFVTKDSHEIISKAAKTLGIPSENLLFESAQRTEVPALLKLADLGIFFILPSYSKKASSATKMGEMLAMNLPIITNGGVGDVEYYFKRGLINTLCDLSSLQAETLDNFPLLNDKETRFLSTQMFSLDQGVFSYSKIYESL